MAVKQGALREKRAKELGRKSRSSVQLVRTAEGQSKPLAEAMLKRLQPAGQVVARGKS
jgi:hypothetical protein